MTISNNSIPPTPILPKVTPTATRSPSPATDSSAVQRSRDTVTLSKKAANISAAAQQVKAMGDTDMAKVAEVKARLQNGTYRVDADKAAVNILAESLLKD